MGSKEEPGVKKGRRGREIVARRGDRYCDFPVTSMLHFYDILVFVSSFFLSVWRPISWEQRDECVSIPRVAK